MLKRAGKKKPTFLSTSTTQINKDKKRYKNRLSKKEAPYFSGLETKTSSSPRQRLR